MRLEFSRIEQGMDENLHVAQNMSISLITYAILNLVRKLSNRRKMFFVKVVVILLVFAFLLISISSSFDNSNAAAVSKTGYERHFGALGQHGNASGSIPVIPGTFETGLHVNPFFHYSSEPAPMGIADYGIGPGNVPYEYNTTSFLGTACLVSLSTYNSSLNYSQYAGGPHGMSFQLNVNLQFFNGDSQYVYWVQNVAFLNTSSNNISFIDNVWNFTSRGANMHNSTFSRNGTLGDSSGTYFYYSLASLSLSGNNMVLHYPTKIEFKVDSSTTASNQPEVVFMYNDGYGWITYDNVVFKFVNDLTADHGFVVDGYNYNPVNFYDAELILGGPDGGTQTYDTSSKLQLQLEYWNNHNYQEITNAYNFGSDTAEGINNVSSKLAYYPENGSLSALLYNYPGELGVLYNSSEIATLQVDS